MFTVSVENKVFCAHKTTCLAVTLSMGLNGDVVNFQGVSGPELEKLNSKNFQSKKFCDFFFDFKSVFPWKMCKFDSGLL